MQQIKSINCHFSGFAVVSHMTFTRSGIYTIRPATMDRRYAWD
jgi:hypothetical protein